MTRSNEHMALVRRFVEHSYQEAASDNLDVVHQYFADNYRDHTSLHPEESGVQAVKELAGDTGQASPDVTQEVLHLASAGDLVFVHWRSRGTHQRQHQITKHVRHLQETGEQGSIPGISLYRIEGGIFVEAWHYHNVLKYALAHGHGQGQGASAAASGDC